MMTQHSNGLQTYKQRFQRLKQANTPYGKAPHKPVLLLAVMRLIGKGVITQNRIDLSPELASEFLETFKILVTTGNRAAFSLPFYHLANDGFWHFQLKTGMQLRGYVKIRPNLHRAFDRGIIGIDKDYRVVVSKHIHEDATTAYYFKKLAGTALYLPMAEKYYPARDIFL